MNDSELKINITEFNHKLEQQSPEQILAWAWEFFRPLIAMTSSFQTQSVPLLHMVSRVAPQMPIFFLDTGFHFPGTLAFRDHLVAELGLKLQVLKPKMGHDVFLQQHGELYHRDPDMCCLINKILPLREASKNLHAWVSGIRRDQTVVRSNTPILSRQPDGLVKVSPLATWNARQIWQYSHDHQLPEHPLLAQGYESIGCAPCTRPIFQGEDPRSGRWPDHVKTECGLHLPLELGKKDPNHG